MIEMVSIEGFSESLKSTEKWVKDDKGRFARKIRDDDEFTRLYLSDLTLREIAKKLDVSTVCVWKTSKRLGLPRRGHIKSRYAFDQKLIDFLRQTEYGYALVSNISNKRAMSRLANTGRLIRVYLSAQKGSGKFPRKDDSKYFNEGFYNQKFVCIDRTALVRLFMHALKKPETLLAKRRVTTLCKRYLTHAEWVAVLWSLGIHHFARSQLKRNMQVDGKYFPIGYKTTEAPLK